MYVAVNEAPFRPPSSRGDGLGSWGLDLHLVRVGLVDQAGPLHHLLLVSHLHQGGPEDRVNPAAETRGAISHVTQRRHR